MNEVSFFDPTAQDFFNDFVFEPKIKKVKHSKHEIILKGIFHGISEDDVVLDYADQTKELKITVTQTQQDNYNNWKQTITYQQVFMIKGFVASRENLSVEHSVLSLHLPAEKVKDMSKFTRL